MRCLEVEVLPSERRMTLDGVGVYREAQAERQLADGTSLNTGVKRGGKNRHRCHIRHTR